MVDWASVVVGVLLFLLLSSGLLFELSGNHRVAEFGIMRTNGRAIFFHALIFFSVFTIVIVAAHLHIYTG